MLVPVAIGTAQNAASSTTIAVTTTAAIPSGGKGIVLVGHRTPTTLSGVAGGGSWTNEQTASNTSGSGFAAYSSAFLDFPSGLAISTVVTATISAASVERFIHIYYCLGLSSGAAYAKNTHIANTTAVAAWDSNLITIAGSGDLVIGGCRFSQSAGSPANAPDTSNTELNDTTLADGEAQMSCYWTGASGSQKLSGTWSGGTTTNRCWVGQVLAYAGTAAAGIIPDVVMAELGTP